MADTRLSLLVHDTGFALPSGARLAVFRGRAGSDYRPFGVSDLRLANSFRPEFDALTAAGFETCEQISGQHPATLVELTRAKAENLGTVAAACAATLPGGTVIVDGAKTDGIESLLKQCKTNFDIAGVISKSHGKLFCLLRPETLPSCLDDWAAAARTAANPDGFITVPGVFSADRIDVGSALLAAHFDARLQGSVADLGAGWGWLAAQALARGDVSKIDLFEAEALALDCARANISDSRAAFHWADVTTLATGQRYDHVISNPPFHTGRTAEPALGVAFITKAAEILHPKGSFWMVANRQLPYEAALERCFAQVKSLQETPHFKLFLASVPRSGSARKPVVDRIKSRQIRR